MEEQSIILKIKSLYTLRNIESYIKDEYLLYKMIFKSKSVQSKLNITLDNYKALYLKKQYNFNLNQFFYAEKNDLNENLNTFLKRYNITKNILELYIIYYYKDKMNEIKTVNKNRFDNYLQKIDINSPFFDFLITKDFFSELFLIVINITNLKQNGLNKDYTSRFNKLNNMNTKYSLYIIFETYKDLDYFHELNFINKNLKKLELDGGDKQNDCNILFKTLFGFNELFENLLFLNLKSYSYDKIKSQTFQNINNLKSLNELELSDFSFDEKVVLDLPNLKKLKLSKCNNISLSEDLCLSLDSLNINLSEIQDKLLYMPNLEFYSGIYVEEAENIVDFRKCKKLKVLFLLVSVPDFLEKIDIPLEYLSFNNIYSKKEEIEAIKKIISLNKLKEANIILTKLNNDDILNIPGINTSLTSLYIQSNNLSLDNLQNKFPNLTKISIKNFSSSSDSSSLKIKENQKSKINEFYINNEGNNNAEFSCGQIKDLISVTFKFKKELKNINKFFPIFIHKPKVNFESLRNLSFSYDYPIKISIINNMFDNLDKMPKLKYLYLSFISKELKKNIYMKYIGKVLSLDVVDIYLIGKLDESAHFNQYYSMNELRQLFPNIDYSKKINIDISKINKFN